MSATPHCKEELWLRQRLRQTRSAQSARREAEGQKVPRKDGRRQEGDGERQRLHQLSEEEDEAYDVEEEDARSDSEASVVLAVDVSAPPPSSHIPVSAGAPPIRKSRLPHPEKTPMSPRGRPAGKETRPVCPPL